MYGTEVNPQDIWVCKRDSSSTVVPLEKLERLACTHLSIEDLCGYNNDHLRNLVIIVPSLKFSQIPSSSIQPLDAGPSSSNVRKRTTKGTVVFGCKMIPDNYKTLEELGEIVVTKTTIFKELCFREVLGRVRDIGIDCSFYMVADDKGLISVQRIIEMDRTIEEVRICIFEMTNRRRRDVHRDRLSLFIQIVVA